jgi:hypothetical protein
MVNPIYYGVGYMNAYHQRVVARGRTRSQRSPVMVIRCAVCGHYYGAAEARLTAQRCPSHDDGLEGQTAVADIEWMEPRQSEAQHAPRRGSASPYDASPVAASYCA